ncbi:MAG: tetratricopeptide repeat protein [Candidatus Omnitrophica bacterium]|nr:tetratricopeptide repeat protein [Candidatus Omnitrophota bacterium]
MDKKLYADVVTLCKKRTAINPSDVTAITYMGIALEELGQWQQAERLYKTAIKQSPDYPTPYYHLGKLFLLKRKDTQAAIKEIEIFKEKSEELSKVDKQAKEGIIVAQHLLVYIYNETLQDYKKAVQEGKYLLGLAPEDQAAHYNLGISYLYLDKKSMAYTEFKKVIDLNPTSEIARYAKEAIESMQKYSSVRSLPYSSE